MADIARRANVSPATVSRVINQTVPVDPATEERVRAAIEELGYRPNLLARSFRRRKTQTIGLLVPDNSNPFFAELARVIEDAGFERQHNVILCNSDLSEQKQADYVDVLLAKRVDGVILTSTGLISSGIDMVDHIREAGVPCVVIDRDLAGYPVDHILIDNVKGGYLAGRHLLQLGHRQLACVVGPSDLTPSAGRISGFRRALEEADVALAPDLIIQGNGRHDGGVSSANALLQQGREFTAIFVFNDVMAIGVIGALQRAGRRVPEDVSVVGFDDISFAAATYPSLTTIAQPIAEMGKLGVEMLINRIQQPDKAHERVTLPTRLVERESTARRPDTTAERDQARTGAGSGPSHH